MKVILYTKNFNKNITEKVDVILSPEFYWIKKLEVNVSLREAKKIAKNIFKLDDKEYIFDAFKLEDKIFVVALNKNLDLKIDKKHINSIHLAQIEFFKFNCVDTKDCIIKKVDDILFCFHRRDEKCVSIDEVLKNINLSKKTFNVYNVINIDKSVLFYLIFSLIIFNLFYFIQGVSYKQELSKIEKEKISLKRYNMPLSLYQLNSIYEALKDEDNKINKIKKVLEFLSLRFRNFEFKKIDYDGNVFSIVIKTDKNLDSYFKNFNILNSKVENENYIVKFKI